MKKTVTRDKTGLTPLFYCVYNNTLFHATSIKELINISRIKPRIDTEGIAAITLLGPGRPKENAVFAGIRELPPGHSVDYEDGKLKINQYWKPQAKQHTESFEETSMRVREMLINSIKKCLFKNSSGELNQSEKEGKFPCLFLSGGLDSSIIGAVMKQEGVPITAYSVDYKNNSDNFKAGAFQPTQDAPFVNEMRKFLGCEYRDVILDTKVLFNSLYGSVIARGLPGMADVDGSLYLFCGEVGKICRSQGVPSTALSGECADELFGGYRWYHDEELLRSTDTFPWMQCVQERANLLRDGILSGINPAEYIKKSRHDIIKDTPLIEGEDEITHKRREMFYLNYYGFMQTLSERNYTMSHAHGLQVLSPFSDPVIAEYAFNIPWNMKSYKGREKGLLRHAFAGMLPDSVLWRKKSPFPKTHNPEYLSLVTQKLSKIINQPDCRVTEIYDKVKLTELIESGGKSFSKNWFGQLMAVPQIFAYIIQLEYWMREYNVKIDI